MKHGVGALVLATVCQGQVLFGAWPVPGGGEHLIAGQHQLDRPPDFPCGDGAQRDVHPEDALRTECTADQGREDADLGFGDAEVGRERGALPRDPTRGVVHGEHVIVPMRDRGREFDRVVRVDRRGVTGGNPCRPVGFEVGSPTVLELLLVELDEVVRLIRAVACSWSRTEWTASPGVASWTRSVKSLPTQPN
jgi:hypothetical protein